MGKLDGKVAIITGGASGMGRATSLLFAKEGAAVVLADVQDGQPVVDEIAQAGGRAKFVRTDVSNASDVQALVQAAVEAFGGLHILHANAGIGGEMAPIHMSSEETWDKVIAINLKGPYLCMKYAIPAILKSGGGSIICTASVGGIVASPFTGAYSSSKGGVIQLVRTAALELAQQGIRVNAICPGVTDTPLAAGLKNMPAIAEQMLAATPMARLAQPEEIAKMALFLASDDSSYSTGAYFLVDGGWAAH